MADSPSASFIISRRAWRSAASDRLDIAGGPCDKKKVKIHSSLEQRTPFLQHYSSLIFGENCTMSVIGSLIFCTDCGNLLRESTGVADATLHCDICGTRNKGAQTRSPKKYIYITRITPGLTSNLPLSRYYSPDYRFRIQAICLSVRFESQALLCPNTIR